MAAGNEVSSTYYIQHHLQNLTFGNHPVNGWSLANTAEEAREMGFWAIHLDTMGWSIAMGLLFIWVFRKAGKMATTGVPGGLQNAVEMGHFPWQEPDDCAISIDAVRLDSADELTENHPG